MIRMGRINARALSGPLTLPSGVSDMVDKVIENYEAWYKVWSKAYIAKLLFKPKWFIDELDLEVGYLVYIQKSESELGSSWMLGMISALDDISSRYGLRMTGTRNMILLNLPQDYSR